MYGPGLRVCTVRHPLGSFRPLPEHYYRCGQCGSQYARNGEDWTSSCKNLACYRSVDSSSLTHAALAVTEKSRDNRRSSSSYATQPHCTCTVAILRAPSKALPEGQVPCRQQAILCFCFSAGSNFLLKLEPHTVCDIHVECVLVLREHASGFPNRSKVRPVPLPQPQWLGIHAISW